MTRLARGAALLVLALGWLGGGPASTGAQAPPRPGAPAPEIAGGPWIGSPPLTTAGLRGRVVVVEFWTYG
jgi:hypothetical protein